MGQTQKLVFSHAIIFRKVQSVLVKIVCCSLKSSNQNLNRKKKLHPLCIIKLNNYCLSWVLLALLKTEVLPLLCKDFLTIIHRHVGWLLIRNRKQKNMSNFWPKTWSWSCKKFESWLFTREPLYLSEKENSYLQSGCLCKVVQL